MLYTVVYMYVTADLEDNAMAGNHLFCVADQIHTQYECREFARCTWYHVLSLQLL